MSPVYEKGNIPYLSDEFMEMLRHTVREARRLGMECVCQLRRTGWVIGGEWVPKEDRSKVLVPTTIDLDGPQNFSSELPTRLGERRYSWQLRSSM